jgi:hypothetical protein
MNPELYSEEIEREIVEDSEIFADQLEVQQSRGRRQGCGMRMVYEDELRKASGRRTVGSEQLRRWVEIRRQLPINRWMDRNKVMQADHQELVALKTEIKQFLDLFLDEANEYGLELDMGRNYYRAAVNLMSDCAQGAAMSDKDTRLLSGLMVMVDLKDAWLAMQILASIA